MLFLLLLRSLFLLPLRLLSLLLFLLLLRLLLRTLLPLLNRRDSLLKMLLRYSLTRLVAVIPGSNRILLFCRIPNATRCRKILQLTDYFC